MGLLYIPYSFYKSYIVNSLVFLKDSSLALV